MIHKTCSMDNLPRGTGIALGSFIRSLYLTAAKRYAVIGINVDGLGFFDTLGANSALVSDLVPLIVGKDYVINPEVISDAHKIADATSLGNVYAITVNAHFSTEITRAHFSSVLKGEDTTSIRLLEPIRLSVTFYISEVVGVVSESIVSAVLHELSIDSTNIFPVSCTGKHISKVWTTYVSRKFTENLTLHVEGPTEEIVDADIKYLQELFLSYAIQAANSLKTLQ